MERRLTTIVAADVVGFSRLMATDEEGVIARLRAIRAEIVNPAVAEAGGRIFKTMGDGLFVEFPSPVAAVRAVISVQESMAARETGPEEERMRFRVGINLGDVVEDGDDILGDGVNVAARLEALATPGGICISRSVHDHLRGKVDAQFTPMGPQKVKNIPDTVDTWRVEIAGTAPPPTVYELPEKPSIIVLPFANMSSEADQEFFCDGMTEDITTALSRFSELFVIARNTAFTFKGRSVEVRDVSRQLGVQYVLEGSVRSAGRRLRVNAQLIDALGDRHVWAEKYDGNVEDIFDFQDELTARIVAAVAPEVKAASIERSRRKSIPDLTVWELTARAEAELDVCTAESLARAIDHAGRAIKADPDYARAHAVLATSHAIEAIYQWNREPAESLRIALAAAEKSVSLDRRDENALMALATCYMIMRRHDEAITQGRRAIEQNPNAASGIGTLGMALVWAHELDEGRQLLRQAIRQSPHDFWTCFQILHLGFADFIAGDYDGAVHHADDAHRNSPQHPTPFRLKAAALGQLGRIDDARETLATLNQIAPGLTITKTKLGVPYAFEDDMDRYCEGLRRAGMPE